MTGVSATEERKRPTQQTTYMAFRNRLLLSFFTSWYYALIFEHLSLEFQINIIWHKTTSVMLGWTSSNLSSLPRVTAKNKEVESFPETYQGFMCLDCLTFSEGQAGICVRPVAEQNEGPLRWCTREVDHFHGALQREVMTQVQQMLQLYCDTSLRCHLLKECWDPKIIDRRESVWLY